MNPERLQKIDRVFQLALDVPPQRWASFLDNACAGDAELRAEVESLLSAHQNAGSFIEGSASDVASSLLKNNPMGRTHLGQYKIDKLLGVGGMGQVYLATDRMGRRVALKLLARHHDQNRNHLARFA